MTKHWYVVRTKSNSESLAASVLKRNGFDVFLPQVQAPVARKHQTHISLFPGYIFLGREHDESELPSLSHMPGIIGLVRFNGVSPVLPDDEVSGLFQRVEQINREGGLWTRFQVGQTVHVESGKLEGLAKVIEEPSSPQARVRVLLEFMGRLVPTQVPMEHLRPAPEFAHVERESKPPRRTRGRGRWIKGFEPKAAPVA